MTMTIKFARRSGRWCHCAFMLFVFMANIVCGQQTSDAITSRAATIPDDFPQFTVPEHDPEMLALRDLFWYHYKGLTPKATLWDEWLLTPTMWPEQGAEASRVAWKKALEGRIIDGDGYVATHQHQSIAHQHGWPFPFWGQGGHGFGWHFSFDQTIGTGWRTNDTAKPDEWKLSGAQSDGIVKEGWALTLTSPHAVMTPPTFESDSHAAPFVQLRWQADDLSASAMPYVEWKTKEMKDFSSERRFYFAPPKPGGIDYTMIPVYRHPLWNGDITGLRLGLDNSTTGGKVIIQALFAQFDTRHDVNNPSYVTACIDYFNWTHDLNFLRDNIERMRLAMRFMETEFTTDKDGIVTVPWVGHEGTTGIQRNADGSVTMLYGYGVGNNYWDLMPFGKQDAYATIRHYGAALKMADIESEISDNPGWNIPNSPLARSGTHWKNQAAMAKENGNKLFWNSETERFTLGVDSEGEQADYGYTFVNLEAIYYDFATEDHAKQIMDWISGRRSVSSDTAQTTDIYHWRFAPRATTLRNTDHYGWFWNGAADIPFGMQVQDGGAVLGFSYHDLMARLAVNGPDDAAQRLKEIVSWYREVSDAGGYRAYYDGKTHEGTLQGGGPPGGLGVDREFVESVLVTQVMLEGFLGFKPTGVGFSIDPKLPDNWPSLRIDQISLRELTLSIAATSRNLTIINTADNPGVEERPLKIKIPIEWRIDGDTSDKKISENNKAESGQTIDWDTRNELRLVR